MTRLSALAAQIDRLRLRMDVLVLGCTRMADELKDNPKRNLALCRCKRMETRYPDCVLCLTERLRKEML